MQIAVGLLALAVVAVRSRLGPWAIGVSVLTAAGVATASVVVYSQDLIGLL